MLPSLARKLKCPLAKIHQTGRKIYARIINIFHTAMAERVTMMVSTTKMVHRGSNQYDTAIFSRCNDDIETKVETTRTMQWKEKQKR